MKLFRKPRIIHREDGKSQWCYFRKTKLNVKLKEFLKNLLDKKQKKKQITNEQRE